MPEVDFEPAVKWTGSKRRVAGEIVAAFPGEYETYYEPFVGGGALLYAADPADAVAGDRCEPLVEIWRLVRDDPGDLPRYYRQAWNRLQDEGETAYYDIRERFNRDGDPRKLFFLTRTCVNGLIRFNRDGEFNASLHLSRPGVRPNRLARVLTRWSRRLNGAEFYAGDYEETLADAEGEDFAFLDPPYFNTETLYYGDFDAERFIDILKQLNERGVKYALTLDGANGETDYTVDLPDWAYKERRILDTGESPYRKVVEGAETGDVQQSLFLNYRPAVGGQNTLTEF